MLNYYNPGDESDLTVESIKNDLYTMELPDYNFYYEHLADVLGYIPIITN